MYAQCIIVEKREEILLNSDVLKDLRPSKVFQYFGELSNIPRGSGNEKRVSDYLVAFAKEHNLEVIQDKAYNVIIKKPGSAGYESSPGVVLQGHMDMVCEKTPTSTHDFSKDPLALRIVDGEWLYATDTTLGADNGIAVAMGLAVMAADDIAHPPLELLVTTSEETGMDGAMALDAASVTGETLLNIDSEEEGILTVSCAGGCSARAHIPLSWEETPRGGSALTLSVGGLLGGHSGIEIHKGRANANKLLGRLLHRLGPTVRLAELCGGSKHNAIAREAHATIVVPAAEAASVTGLVHDLERALQGEYKTADPGLRVTVTSAEQAPEWVMTRQCAQQVGRFLYLVPDGVQSMSVALPGLVESSLNLGVLRTAADAAEMVTAIRSCVGSIKGHIYSMIETIGDLTGAALLAEGQYPEWQYDPDSRLREVCIVQYEALFGRKPGLAAIHAGLECALFAEKFEGRLDMISMGPDMMGVHTAEEHLSIPSTARTWEYLLAVLKALK